MKRIKEFDFMSDCEYFYDHDSNVHLYIKRINHSVAVLYFIDEMNNKINIPDDVVVYTTDYQDCKKRVIINPIDEYYHLCWTDDYTVELNKKVLINVKNQRKWIIS